MIDQERDLRWLQRVQAGEKEALASLYDVYSPTMLALARRIVGDQATAEDVLHEAWLQVWKRASDYRPKRGTVAAWLVVRVRSRALDRRRRRATRARLNPEASDQLEPKRPAGPQAEASELEVQRAVSGALDELEDKHRSVLELAFFEGLSQREVAERLDTPLGTVKYRMRRGLEELRRLLPSELLE